MKKTVALTASFVLTEALEWGFFLVCRILLSGFRHDEKYETFFMLASAGIFFCTVIFLSGAVDALLNGYAVEYLRGHIAFGMLSEYVLVLLGYTFVFPILGRPQPAFMVFIYPALVVAGSVCGMQMLYRSYTTKNGK